MFERVASQEEYPTEGQKGAYFITLCVKDRHELGMLVGEHNVLPQLSEIGLFAETAINNISDIYDSVIVDKYVIMPNHIHMIILIVAEDGRTMCAPTVQ
jgi:putative transposase